MVEQKNETFDIVKKIFFGFVFAVISFVYLSVYPYFPAWFSGIFSLALVVISFFNPAVAAVLISIALGLAIAYHAVAVFLFYAIVLTAVIAYAWSQQVIAEACLVVGLAPLLAYVYPGMGLEFIVVFMAPLLVSKGRAAVLVFFAYVWCLLYATVNHKETVGNIVVALCDFDFYSIRQTEAVFYDFSWVIDKFLNFPSKNFTLTATAIVSNIFSYAGMMLQGLLWSVAAFLMAWFIERQKVFWHFLAVISAIIVLMTGQYVNLIFTGASLDFKMGNYIISLSAVAVLILIFIEIFNILNKKYSMKAIGVGDVHLPQAAHGGAAPMLHVPDSAVALHLRSPLRGEKVSEFLKERPSLEETIRVQQEINEYMKKRFVHDASVLAIDVVGSTALKKDESSNAVIATFTDFWRVVDGATYRRDGRLLNRAGDGAIYVFKYPDQAVQAAKEIVAALAKFNRKGNLLKNPFQVRMGMETGQIVEQASGPGSDVFSHVIDIAAHLEAQAPVNGLLVSEATYVKLSRFKGDFTPQGKSNRDNIETYLLKG